MRNNILQWQKKKKKKRGDSQTSSEVRILSPKANSSIELTTEICGFINLSQRVNLIGVDAIKN